MELVHEFLADEGILNRNEKRIAFAGSDADVDDCFAVMATLRPQFHDAEDFRRQVARQTGLYDFRLAFLALGGGVKAVAGVRLGEWLANGRYLEIEDLVTSPDERSNGYGGELFDWLVEFARRENCRQIKLVSHVERFAAHRFYLRKGMIIEAHYFSKAV